MEAPGLEKMTSDPARRGVIYQCSHSYAAAQMGGQDATISNELPLTKAAPAVIPDHFLIHPFPSHPASPCAFP